MNGRKPVEIKSKVIKHDQRLSEPLRGSARRIMLNLFLYLLFKDVICFFYYCLTLRVIGYSSVMADVIKLEKVFKCLGCIGWTIICFDIPWYPKEKQRLA